MSRTIKFDPSTPLPLVYARLHGPKKAKKVRFVLDTGAVITQISTMIIEEIGYSARDGIKMVSAYGPSGPVDEGYALEKYWR